MTGYVSARVAFVVWHATLFYILFDFPVSFFLR